MIINWGIEDGYQDGGRAWQTEIPDNEFDGLSKAESEEVIEDWVKTDFEQYVTWYIKDIEGDPRN